MNTILTLDQKTLPEWDLSDLYASTDSKELEKDLADAHEEAKAFHMLNLITWVIFHQLWRVPEHFLGNQES